MSGYEWVWHIYEWVWHMPLANLRTFSRYSTSPVCPSSSIFFLMAAGVRNEVGGGGGGGGWWYIASSPVHYTVPLSPAQQRQRRRCFPTHAPNAHGILDMYDHSPPLHSPSLHSPTTHTLCTIIARVYPLVVHVHDIHSVIIQEVTFMSIALTGCGVGGEGSREGGMSQSKDGG